MSALTPAEIRMFEQMVARKAMAGEVTDEFLARIEQAKKDLASIVTESGDRTGLGGASTE